MFECIRILDINTVANYKASGTSHYFVKMYRIKINIKAIRYGSCLLRNPYQCYRYIKIELFAIKRQVQIDIG